jgi:tRNA U38,U39,U40 pseudouridine synthase TruA
MTGVPAFHPLHDSSRCSAARTDATVGPTRNFCVFTLHQQKSAHHTPWTIPPSWQLAAVNDLLLYTLLLVKTNVNCRHSVEFETFNSPPVYITF